MTTPAHQAAARIKQALEAFELAMGASQGIPAREVLIRACSPDSLRALLAERDELAKDAARWRFIRDEAVWRADPDGRGEMLWAVVGTRHDDCTPIDGAELDAACDERLAALTNKD